LEKEKEQFLANFEIGPNNSEYYSKNMLEKQAGTMINL